MAFDLSKYFDSVRSTLFAGHMSQDQVDGQQAILDGWAARRAGDDRRWLAYFLATAYHETSKEMQPIEEYNKGEGQPYGEPDPETGNCFYGRGFVQLTWKDNYRRADDEVGCDSVNHPEQQLQAEISGATGYIGMVEGWFRGDKLSDYFNDTIDDPYEAREIINGDKSTVPSWSDGVSIGNLIAGYHGKFLKALKASKTNEGNDGT
jgi:predicted chitinase